MKKTYPPYLAVAVLPLFLTACSDKPMLWNQRISNENITRRVDPICDKAEVVITNIVKVFLCEPPYHYSVMSMGKNNKLLLHDLDMSVGVYIYADVPQDKSMWAVYIERNDSWSGPAEIHIHNPDDINGAGCVRTGKQKNNGTTTVVE